MTLITWSNSRLKNLNLKNKDTGHCVHPEGGSPGEEDKLGYWHSCPDEDRTKLEFLKLGKQSADSLAVKREQIVFSLNVTESQTESREGHLFIDSSCGRQAVLQTVKAKGLASLQD